LFPADLNPHRLQLAKVPIRRLDFHIKGMEMKILTISVTRKMKRKKMMMMTRTSVVMIALMNEWKT
jgi:hypothetical protein